MTEWTTALGHAALAILVAIVGFILNRKANKIHVLVNSRMTKALKRIAQLEEIVEATPGVEVPPTDNTNEEE